MIAYTCPACGNLKQLPDELAGRRVLCKKCGHKGRADYPVGKAAEPSGKEVEELWAAADAEQMPAVELEIDEPADESLWDSSAATPTAAPKSWFSRRPPTPQLPEPLMTRSQGQLVWVLLLVLAVSQVMTCHRLNTDVSYEFKVLSPRDAEFENNMYMQGLLGWDIVSARRASDGGDARYELILRRRR